MEFYLEDFEPGCVLQTPSVTITQAQIIDFAKQYDPQPYHLDADEARRSVFGGLVAGGFQIAALAWALALRSGYFDHCAMAGLGVDELRWRAPLRPEDTVKCAMEVLQVRHSISRSDSGIIVFRYIMTNQNNEIILTLKLTQMLKRRPKVADSIS
jgi:acyl dehydratase